MPELPPVIVSLLANVDSFKASMAEAQGSMDETAASSEASAGGLSSFAKVGLLAVGAAVVGVAAGAVDMGLKFQDSTHALAASADISVAAANRIGAAFTGQAFSTTFSAQTTIKAYTGVAAQMDLVAGHVLSAAQSLAFMKTAQDLAEGSGNALGSTTADLAKVMQAYQIPLKGASDASNILFTVSRDTGVGLDTVSQSLARARAAMGAAAPPLATMGGLMLDLTQHGETGRQAISTLTSAFTGIISPTAAVTAAQAAMGVSFINAKTGGLDPMSQIFSELQPKLAGMSPTMAAATLKTLGFGSASAKLAETIQAGPAVLDKYTASVTAAGAAHDAAAKQADTMKGELEKLKSGAGDLMTELGTVLVPALTAVVGALLSVATWVGTVIPVIAKFVTGVVNSAIVKTIFTDIATAVGKAIAFISSVIGTVTSWIKDHWTQISTDTASAWAVISNILTVAWNIISKIIQFAVAVIVPLLQTTWSIISTAVSVAWNIISTIIGTAITVIIAVISTIVKIISFLVGVWQTVTSDVSNFIGGVVNFFIALPGRIMGAISGIYNTVGGFLSGVWSHISTDVGIAIGDVVNWFLGMPGKIVGALGNLGNLLFNIGASIIGGLLNGIKSALNDVKNFVSGIAGKIMSWKGPLDYDATILVPHGNAIMAGLVAGIQQGLNGPVKAALGQVTSTIAGTSFVSPMSLGAGNLAAAGGGGFGGIGGAGGSAPVQITYNIPVTGDMSPQTVLYLKQQLQQHDQELITKLGAA